MYRIVLCWDEVPPNAGQTAANDIKEDFARNRPWHKNVICTWDTNNNSLILQADNDYDENGLALRDEFSDEISACIKEAGDGEIRVVSVTKIP